MASNQDDATEEMPDIAVLCPPCYEYVKASIAEFAQDPDSAAWRYAKERIVITWDPFFCQSPKCVFPEYIKQATNGKKLWASSADRCRGGPREDPDVCRCKDPHFKAMHEKILSCINRMERAFEELQVAEGVTIQLSKQVRVSKQIDPAEPKGVIRGFMENVMEKFSNLSMNVNVNNAQMETKPGRPLSVIHPNSEFHCHYAKVQEYVAANCACTQMACSCDPCILHHVEHCAEDYEDAVKRARGGITKLRDMRSTGTAVGVTLSGTQAEGGGSEMPGVRKAKHLHNYTKAKKDEHNYR